MDATKLATMLLLVFSMQFVITIQASAPVFNIGSLLSKNGFSNIANDKTFKPKLAELSKLLNTFFKNAGKVQANDLGFVLRDDLPSMMHDLANAMDAYKKTLKIKLVSDQVGRAATLFAGLVPVIKTVATPLTIGHKRKGKPLYSKKLGQYLVGLSGNIGKLLKNKANKFLPVFAGFFKDIGLGVGQVLEGQLKNVPILVRPAVSTLIRQLTNIFGQIVNLFK